MTATLPQRLGLAFRRRREALGFSQVRSAPVAGSPAVLQNGVIERGLEGRVFGRARNVRVTLAPEADFALQGLGTEPGTNRARVVFGSAAACARPVRKGDPDFFVPGDLGTEKPASAAGFDRATCCFY